MNVLERFVVLEHSALIQAGIEKIKQTDAASQLLEEEEQERNTEQFIQQELWKKNWVFTSTIEPTLDLLSSWYSFSFISE